MFEIRVRSCRYTTLPVMTPRVAARTRIVYNQHHEPVHSRSARDPAPTARTGHRMRGHACVRPAATLVRQRRRAERAATGSPHRVWAGSIAVREPPSAKAPGAASRRAVHSRRLLSVAVLDLARGRARAGI